MSKATDASPSSPGTMAYPSQKGSHEGEEPPPTFEEAVGAQPPTLRQTRFAIMALNMRDRIRLINFPEAEERSIEAVVKDKWAQGIQDVRRLDSALEIKCNGYPWNAAASQEDVSRGLVLAIVERMYDLSWQLHTTLDICKDEADKDAFVFRKLDATPFPCDWILVTLHAGKLKIIGEPPLDLCEAFVAEFGPSVRDKEITARRLKLKLHYSHWSPSSANTVSNQLSLLKIFQTLERFGFSLYGVPRITKAYEGNEVDILIFNRPCGWSPGQAVRHR